MKRTIQRTIIPILAVVGIAVVFFLRAAQSAPSDSKSAKAGETSNVACYFRRTDGTISWQWGLTGSNEYFSFSGDWKSTSYTKLKKFFSTVDYSSLCDACQYTKTYYKEPGELFAMFAATSNSGYNYPIILGGNEISPLF